jgi:hypothetical protein
MNIYTELKRKARAKRDKAIKSVHEHYRATLHQIKAIQRADEMRLGETGYRERQLKRGRPGTPINQLCYGAAAERVLLDGKPLRMTELILELKGRGFRPGKCPRVMAVTMSGTLHRHASRFAQDNAGKWRVV